MKVSYEMLSFIISAVTENENIKSVSQLRKYLDNHSSEEITIGEPREV